MPSHARAHELCIILDFGSQYSQLIARRVRENQVYCEILSHRTSAAELQEKGAKAVILSGGPCGVYEENAPDLDPEIFALGVPILSSSANRASSNPRTAA